MLDEFPNPAALTHFEFDRVVGRGLYQWVTGSLIRVSSPLSRLD